MRVDAHHHLWDPEVVEYPWLGPDLEPLHRAFRPAELEQHIRASHVEATVVVQAANSREDTSYLLHQAAEFDWIAAVVGWVDLREPRAVRKAVAPGARHPKLRGIRHLLDEEPSGWALEPTILAGLEVVAEAGLVLDLPALFPRHLENVPRLARCMADLPIVIDHLASPPPGRSAFAPWSRQLAAAAAFPNVYGKLSGIRTAAAGKLPSSAAIAPYVAHALAVFGAERLMWGSDWPVSLLAADYPASWSAVEDALHGCSTTERDAIFGATAARLYGIAKPAPTRLQEVGVHG